IHIPGYRKSNGVQRINFYSNVTITPTYSLEAPSGYTPIFRIQLGNLYRDGGSDGYSALSCYVEGFTSAAPPTATYEPGTYVPVTVDYLSPDSYPPLYEAYT